MKLMTLYGYLILFVLINKKASDRVWHATLVATTGKCTINKVSSVVCIYESIGHQCLTRLSSITFAYSLQYLLGTGYVRGTWGPLAYPKKYSHESALCMRFWWICTHTQFSMDMSTLKAILSSEGIQESKEISWQSLGRVIGYKYLGSTASEEGSKSEMLSWIAQTTTTYTKLKLIWNDRKYSTGIP